MRITTLGVRNLLAFGPEEQILVPDPHLTVVVGPNGAGKSNLVRALTVVGSVIEDVEQPASPGMRPTSAISNLLDGYARACHQGGEEEPREVHLGIELTESDEHDLVVSFVQSLVLSHLLTNSPNRSWEQQLDQDLLEVITKDTVRDLTTGILHATHSGARASAWELAYEFPNPNPRFRLVIRGEGSWNHIYALPADPSRQRVQMSAKLGIPSSPGATAPHTRVAAFCLSLILPLPAEELEFSTVRLLANSDGLLVYRRFFERAGIDRSIANPREFWSFATVLRRIFADRLVLTRDLRGHPKTQYRAEELARSIGMADETLVPARLYHWKNGDDEGRARFGHVQKVFRDLTDGLELDVESSVETVRQSTAIQPTSFPAVATSFDPSGAQFAQQAASLTVGQVNVEQ
ncbi:MAG: hypothetical protein ACYCOU_17500, partial [Sulfobacillus sp.]